MDTSVKPVDWAIPGERAGLKTLESFCNERLQYFSDERNDPTKSSLSNLSPWLHTGQVSAQRCILMVKKLGKPHKASVDAFIEEAVIRSELADNFCFYQENYDSLKGTYDWAKTSLKEHEKDEREYTYTQEQFENAKTHDQLWNAAQIQLLIEGKMHGFLRMYWAKKILEWTPSPAEGLRIAIYLNDRYSLDGMDSNGYVDSSDPGCEPVAHKNVSNSARQLLRLILISRLMIAGLWPLHIYKHYLRYFLITMPKRPASSVASELPAQKAKKEKNDLFDIVKQSRLQHGTSILDCKFNKKRVRMLTEVDEFPQEANGGVLYWMARDQRIQDNWAMLFAQRLALKEKTSLHVCFCLVSPFLEATERHYDFIIRGLQEIEKDCQDLDINFHLLQGNPSEEVSKLVKDKNIAAVVTDFNPLRIPRQWVDDLVPKLPKSVGLCQVDTHNVVPCWIASPKQEYGARTIRNKIHSQLCNFLTEFPPVIVHPHKAKETAEPVDWLAERKKLKMDTSVKPVDWAIPGERAGLKTLESFCNERLQYFSDERNDPTKSSLSNLSPWLHTGQVSAQRCILMVKKLGKPHKASVDAFIEEAVIRSELADNFCFYQENYDSLKGTYDWAKTSLKEHEKDDREYTYTQEQFENAKTHDQLWNAAQIQLLIEGKMHGFLRMYWAKKILEWTPSPAEGLRIAIYLNDRYSLDGMDSNGYVGCLWSVGGIHDRGWGERPIFGKIRYMNFNGCKRKFDVDAFIRQYKAKAKTIA